MVIEEMNEIIKKVTDYENNLELQMVKVRTGNIVVLIMDLDCNESISTIYKFKAEEKEEAEEQFNIFLGGMT